MSKTWKIINGVRPLFYFRAVRYAGGYPVVVVSQNAMNRHLETVVICLIAASGMEPGMEKQISCAGRETEIAVDQLLTISYFIHYNASLALS